MEKQDVTVEEICCIIDLLQSSTDDYIYVYDLINDFYHISPHAVDRFHMDFHTFHDVVANHAKFVYPEDINLLQDDLNAMKLGFKDGHNLQYRWMDKNGDPVWINCRGSVVRKDGVAQYMIGCVNEIGKKQKADNISGLLGESSVEAYLDEKFPNCEYCYILRIGIDGFKEINEKFGVEYGDMVLRKTADLISRCILPEQQLYRLVADEFLIVDFHKESGEELLNVYKKARQLIDQFLDSNNYEVMYTISGGIIEHKDIGEYYSYSNVMRLSEFALNEAKRRGKNQCYKFNQNDYDAFLKQKELSNVVLKAVVENLEGFELHFQPLIALDGRIYGAETLLRFSCEEYGRISPAELIPILEETRLIIPVGRWIIDQACKACKELQEYIPEFKISINLSYIQILKSDIIYELENAVHNYGLPKESVIVELTESGLLETDVRLSKFSSKLKERGIALALDDFGTGYSNFHYLYDLRPDIIKFDRSFVSKAVENDYEYNLLALMSEMIHNLDLKVCMEGIETEHEENRIKRLSPDYSQGYYYGRPCSYLDFVEKFINY